MYDWANSAFWTSVIVAVFPPFFSSFAGSELEPAVATARFATATTIAVTIVAVLSPILGAVADYAGVKKKMLGAFMLVGVLATAAMALIQQGQWLFAAALFVVGNIGVAGSLTFYDSLLPHIADGREIDRVSTGGFALGFLGGGLLLLLNFAWYLRPGWFGIPDETTAIRLVFLSVAVWWLVFSIPLFRRVPEPARRLEADERAGENPMAVAFERLGETLRGLRAYRHAFLMLLAFLLYNDGIQTIIRMATIYATEIGIDRTSQMAAIVLVQFVGIPFTILFGLLAGRIGAKASIFLSLVIYTVISVVGYYMTTAAHFFVLATLVATVQGGSQALSRSLFARMIPQHKSSEYFGFFSVFEKFAGIFGPALFAIMVTMSGSSRNAILSVIAFFVAGGILLMFVDAAEGERAAREAEGRELGTSRS